MNGRRDVVRVALPSGLLASFATAALAHGGIGLLGDAEIGGDAYGTHAHAAVVPVVLAALMLFAFLLLRSALHAYCGSQSRDLIANLGRRCGELRPLGPGIAVALGGLATLFAMEFAEQYAAAGHVAGVSDALGGNALLGLTIVAIVAALVTIVGLRCAHVLLAGAVAAVDAFVIWIAAKRHTCARVATVRRARRECDVCAPAHFARCFGMRAPPAVAIV